MRICRTLTHFSSCWTPTTINKPDSFLARPREARSTTGTYVERVTPTQAGTAAGPLPAPRTEKTGTPQIRIPFSTLRHGSDPEQVWGLNLTRYIRRRNEQVVWSPVQPTLILYTMAYTDGLEF